MKIRFMLLALLMLLMAACSSEAVSEEEAEEAIINAFAGNIEEANEHICEDEQLEASDINGMESVSVTEARCIAEGGDNIDLMVCTYTVDIGGAPVEQTTRFNITDGKLCSSEGASLNPAIINDVVPPETQQSEGEANSAEAPGENEDLDDGRPDGISDVATEEAEPFDSDVNATPSGPGYEAPEDTP